MGLGCAVRGENPPRKPYYFKVGTTGQSPWQRTGERLSGKDLRTLPQTDRRDGLVM